MVDRFPEAFRRFERDVDIDGFRSYRELVFGFSLWAGRGWVDSHKQNFALAIEAMKRGFVDAMLPRYLEKPSVKRIAHAWRHETVTVRGKPQTRYRDLKTGRFIRKP